MQLRGVEGHLADRGVDDPELVRPKLDLAALHLAHGARDILGDRARLRVGHEAARAEDLAQRPDARHQVRRRDRGVKVRPALGYLLDEVLAAHEVGPGLLSLASPVADRKHGDAHLLACAVGEHDRPAHHLLGVARIDSQADVSLDGGVELGDRRVLRKRDRLLGGEPAVAVGGHRRLDLLGRLDVFLSVSLRHYSMTSRPIDRSVPSIIFMAASVSKALRSLRLVSTICLTCCLVTRPIFSRFGFADPFSTPAARLSRFTVGGVLSTNENERSSKIVNSMMLMPCGPNAVPTGGAGVARPACSSSLSTARTFFFDTNEPFRPAAGRARLASHGRTC